jgi:hypothetical protein
MAYGMFSSFMGRCLIFLWALLLGVWGMREEGRKESSVGMSKAIQSQRVETIKCNDLHCPML